LTPAHREKRERIVREHMESENRKDFEATLSTFPHPRYELVATGDVYDGRDAVLAYYAQTRGAFPDQKNRIVSLRHADDAVIVEFELTGTHLGNYRGLPPTGRHYTCPMVAVFVFEEDRLVCERVYFDASTLLRQLGIAHNPLSLKGRVATLLNHPLVIGGAFLRQLFRRR
jgi:steroid delta-isomerase-like uncharacterized protein